MKKAIVIIISILLCSCSSERTSRNTDNTKNASSENSGNTAAVSSEANSVSLSCDSLFPEMNAEQKEAFENKYDQLGCSISADDSLKGAAYLACFFNYIGKGDRKLCVIIENDKKELFSSDEWISLEGCKYTSTTGNNMLPGEIGNYSYGYICADELLEKLDNNADPGRLVLMTGDNDREYYNEVFDYWYSNYHNSSRPNDTVQPCAKALSYQLFGGLLFQRTSENGTTLGAPAVPA